MSPEAELAAHKSHARLARRAYMKKYDQLPERKQDRAARLRRRRQQAGRIFSWWKKYEGCQKCGYARSAAALHFHHLVPSEKLFEVNQRRDRPWNQLIDEACKCQLLCANCHAETEEELRRAI